MKLLVPAGIIAAAIYFSRDKKKKPKSVSTVDRGYFYDCKSFQITDPTKFDNYLTSMVGSLAKLPKYSDPFKIKLKDFFSDAWKRLDATCAGKISMSNPAQNLVLVSALFNIVLSKYLFVQYGTLSLRPIEMCGETTCGEKSSWVTADTTEDEIVQQDQYWNYYLSWIQPQWNEILGKVNPNDVALATKVILSGEKFSV